MTKSAQDAGAGIRGMPAMCSGWPHLSPELGADLIATLAHVQAHHLSGHAAELRPGVLPRPRSSGRVCAHALQGRLPQVRAALQGRSRHMAPQGPRRASLVLICDGTMLVFTVKSAKQCP